MTLDIETVSLVVSVFTLLSITAGLLEVGRRWRKEAKADSERHTRQIVEELLGELSPKLENVSHELSANSGTSTKDKVDLLLKELGSMRIEQNSIRVTLDQVKTNSEFWARQVLENRNSLSDTGERLSALEAQIERRKRRRLFDY